MIQYLYTYEHGNQLTLPPELAVEHCVYSKFLANRRLLLANTRKEMDEMELTTVPGTDPSKCLIAVPIISSDRILGGIQIEEYEREYAFGESEQRLLTTIAPSLGAALENAHLFDETQRLLKETEQRNTELAIINSIQQGLAAELDFQAIVDLVGDKLREVFDLPDLGIIWHDDKRHLLHYLYMFEHGERLNVPAQPPLPGGVFETILKTRQPVINNSPTDRTIIARKMIEGTDESLSDISVPIISSDRVLGLITLDNYERENAYGESEVRLLTTIAGTLGAALENAHLFDETQRLLKETEQRSSELAILNSVGEAMAKTLDVKTVTKIVGDKVCDIFQADIVSIMLLDASSNMITGLYTFDKGEGGYDDQEESFPLGTGLTSKVITSRQPLLLEHA